VLYDQAADLFEKVKKETSDAGVSMVYFLRWLSKRLILKSAPGRSYIDLARRSKS